MKKTKQLLFLSGIMLSSLGLQLSQRGSQTQADTSLTTKATTINQKSPNNPFMGFNRNRQQLGSNQFLAGNLRPYAVGPQTNFGEIVVTPSNFTNYFNMNGSASWDANAGTLLLTPDQTHKTGNATLKTKISINDDFHVQGKFNLGNKSGGRGGADGIALAFHTGENTRVGAAGGCLGIANLPNGFGFKLDTFWDPEGTYDGGGYTADPVRFKDVGKQAFGAFAYNKIVNGISTVDTYDPKDEPAEPGKVTVKPEEKPQQIAEPSNNNFLPFKADYSGKDHTLRIEYNNVVWKTNIDKWIPQGTTSLSFAITGVTGGSCNLQQFKLEEFAYTGYGVVNTKFVDPDGKEIGESSPQVSAKVGEQVSLADAITKIAEIENAGKYYLVGATDQSNHDFNPYNETIMATEAPQTITYRFEKVQTDLKAKDITIYQDEPFDPQKGFDESSKAINGSALDYNQIDQNNPVNQHVVGKYEVNYTYTPKNGFGKSLKPVSATSHVKVIERKHITLNYVDQHHQPIDPRLLADLPDGIKSGDHDGAYGSKFNLVKKDELSLGGKKYYDFLRFEAANPATVINDNQVVFGDQDQTINVVYQGVKIEANDTNEQSRITVHHYLKDSNPKFKVKADTYKGGYIGDSVTVGPDDPEQEAPVGYSIVPNQAPVPWILKPGEGKEVEYYYTANPQTNITVHFVNAKTGKKVASYVPQGHVTGDTLDLTAQNQELITKIPDGYHYASADDLDGKTDASGAPLKQPTSLIYQPNPSLEESNATVYVTGEPVDDKTNKQSRITVHHYLKDSNPKVKVKEDTYVGGYIGDTVTISKDDLDQKAPDGYKIEDEPKEYKRELTYKSAEDRSQEVAFYYTAEEQNNITVKFVNAKNGAEVDTQTPPGHTGEELDLTADSNYIRTAMPKGYRYAEATELPKGKTQPGKLTYKTTPQTAIVYVMGKPTDASNQIIVHHYLQGTTTNVPEMSDTVINGIVGDTVTITKNDATQKATPGYKLVSGPNEETFKFKAEQITEVIFYYVASDQNNITIKFINAKTEKEVRKADNPAGKTGDTLNLQVDSDYIRTIMPEGYHYATGAELNGKTQPANLTFTTQAQTETVYVAPDKAKQPVSVEIINLKDNKDNIIGSSSLANPKVDPSTGHAVYKIEPIEENYIGDEVDPKDYIKLSSDPATLTSRQWKLPVGYRYATDPEIASFGLNSAKPEFGFKEVKAKLYVIKEKVPVTVKINHLIVRKRETAGNLKPVVQTFNEGDELMIDTNNRLHKAPLGYKVVGASWGSNTVDRRLSYNSRNGLITGTVIKPGEDGTVDLNILYQKY